MKPQIERIVRTLNLQPHPEGGFFRETYRSSDIITQACLGDEFSGSRNFSTCIYFLLTSDNFSAFHRIKADEVWHFYAGSPLLVHVIDHEGNYTPNLIGNDIAAGQQPQFVVPAGHWFASSVKEPDSYSLAGCTVAPGFDFRDFEMAECEALIAAYPAHKEIILMLTRA